MKQKRNLKGRCARKPLETILNGRKLEKKKEAKENRNHGPAQ
jgi:hypothetical protein